MCRDFLLLPFAKQAIMSSSSAMCFKNQNLQHEFQQRGFTTAPLLNSAQVQALTEIFYRHFNASELPDVYDTVASTPAAVIRAVDEEVVNICKPALDTLLDNYHWICAIYFIKKSTPQSHLGLHVDPSLTTEDFSTISLWIPLCDIDETTGRICFLPGSEKLLPPYFTPTMPFPFKEVEPLVAPHLQCLSMKAGDALLFNNNALHCTEKNTSGNTRLAIVAKLIDKNAPLATVYYNPASEPGKQVALYEQPKDYFQTAAFRSPEPPAASRFLKFIPRLPVVLTAEAFRQCYK